MTRPNAELSLPPGDRNDAPPAALPASESAPIAGRDATTGGGNPEVTQRIERIGLVLDEAQQRLGEIKPAIARGDLAAAEATAWLLAEALMADPRVLAAELRRAITRQRHAPPARTEEAA